MKKVIIKIVLVFCAMALLGSCKTGDNVEIGTLEAATKLQKELKGKYEELFSDNTLLNSKWDSFWFLECEKAVGKDSAASTVLALKHSMTGTLIGEPATDAFGDGSDGWQRGFQFDCNFKQGVELFLFDGKGQIKGFDSNGKELFSHKYIYDGYNADYDFYFFKSEDANRDEFSYFAIRSDTPKTTHHIEFRYGTDKKSLSEFCTGKYAYWMAAGVLLNSESEQKESIRIFVKENCGV